MIQIIEHEYDPQLPLLCDFGDALISDGDFSAAMQCWMRALELLPAPRFEQPLAARIYSGIAEVCLGQGEIAKAKAVLRQARRSVGASGIPAINARLGELSSM